MAERLDALDAFDRAVARLEATRSLAELAGAFADAAGRYPFCGAAFSWWSHPPPAREPDFRIYGGGLVNDSPGLVDGAGDIWASSLPVITPGLAGDSGGRVEVRVPLLGPRTRLGVLDMVLAIGIREINEAEHHWRGRFLILAHVLQQSISQWSSDERPPLGRREVQCLKLAADGLKAKQIASELGIGQQTVQFHLSRAREKLNCSNTVQAVARAAQFGLLPDISPSAGSHM
jgi:DNA-binding CsgD family transcriptional regulator